MKEFFEFARPVQIGILMLIVLLIGGIVWRVWPMQGNPPEIEFTYFEPPSTDTSVLDQRRIQKSSPSSPQRQWKLKTFDPNYAKARDFRAMGFSSVFITRWFAMKQEVGFVKSLNEFKQLELLHDTDIETVGPFLDFARYQRVAQKPKIKNREVVVLDINLADSSDFRQLKGIGSVLSSRIIRFRNRLGGFHSVSQLEEVYGIKPELIRILEPSLILHSSWHRMDLNSATESDLNRHPYFNYKQVDAIIRYRTQHGRFASVDELNKLPMLTPDWIIKVEPYLEVKD